MFNKNLGNKFNTYDAFGEEKQLIKAVINKKGEEVTSSNPIERKLSRWVKFIILLHLGLDSSKLTNHCFIEMLKMMRKVSFLIYFEVT
jgi:hypothetical protein